MSAGLLHGRDGIPFPSALLQEREDWGLRTLDLVNPPRRFWADKSPPSPVVEIGIDTNRATPWPTPGQLLASLPAGDNWSAQSRRSIARLQAHFLICEDPQRRMDSREVETLAHQVSLVRHVLDSDHLRKVLIADEVGLGKTVEVGLLIGELLAQHPGLRILYLAPARLVSNVRREFDRMGLAFRQWTASDGDARLTDNRILASLHRAVHGDNSERIRSTAPWDVVIVDECHHLSAWDPGAGDPREAYKLVRELIRKQSPEGRVVFLSGTPHQGNITRFENLLRLLADDPEQTATIGGRVIYRTKDDVQDWHGNRLFPARQVNEPTVVDLGPEHRAWVDRIHAFYKPPQEGGQAKLRAAGWRCAQALQWAASSPQAGLGYLVRQAVRAGWDLKKAVLKTAIAALRPYRLGTADEPIEQVYQRILRDVHRQKLEHDVEDIDDSDDDHETRQHDERLAALIEDGVEVLQRAGDGKWKLIKQKLLDPAGDEKVVLFAQPIETVVALARFLESETGRKPALIIGGQDDAERQREVDAFRAPDGPQFLVASRAGGEGINLQIARRLVHVDVPWNPMDLEQRVGRVHRFGSRRTILVDTVVVKNSREEDAYRIARSKLAVIASMMVETERFDATFSRVMCIVPPEELQAVMLGAAPAPFTDDEQARIAEMVQRGFNTWSEFHKRFGAEQRLIRLQDPGLAAWQDVARFMVEHGRARMAEGFKSLKFILDGESIEEAAVVIALEDGQHFICGDTGGAFVPGHEGQVLRRLGLNIGPVAGVLRRLAFPKEPTGAALLKWNKAFPLPPQAAGTKFGVLICMRQTVRTDASSGWTEHGAELDCRIVGRDSTATLTGHDKAELLRGLFAATARLKPESDADDLTALLQNAERFVVNELRRPTDPELRAGIRHAVTPLLAAVVS